MEEKSCIFLRWPETETFIIQYPNKHCLVGSGSVVLASFIGVRLHLR